MWEILRGDNKEIARLIDIVERIDLPCVQIGYPTPESWPVYESCLCFYFSTTVGSDEVQKREHTPTPRMVLFHEDRIARTEP